MPGAFTHFALLHKVTYHPKTPKEVVRLLTRYYAPAYWGSFGPDILYFHPEDWAVIGPVAQKIYDAYSLLERIIETSQRVADVYERPMDWVQGGLHAAIGDTLTQLQALVASAVLDHITSGVDLFELIRPPLHDAPVQSAWKKWWWIDIGHHMETGEYTRVLFQNARADPFLQSYCYGHLTHVAADVLGHPFVNLLVGAPYRNQWRRHTLVEKVIDVDIWEACEGGDLSGSNAYKALEMEDSDTRKIAQLVSETCAKVYGNIGKSSTPSINDVEFMLAGFKRWFKAASSTSMLNITPPPDNFDWLDLDDFVAKKLEELHNSQPPFPAPSDLTDFSLANVKAFLLGLVDYVAWCLEAAVTIATLPLAVLSRLAITPLRYLLYLLNKLIYEAYEKFRVALSLQAFVHPTPSMLSQYFGEILRPKVEGLIGRYPFDRKIEDHTGKNRQIYHLFHPKDFGAALESPQSQPFAFKQMAHLRDYFLSNNDAHSGKLLGVCGQNLDDLLKYFGPGSSAIAEGVTAIVNYVFAGGLSGLPNWNLDGDRGYGWPCWATDANRPWPDTRQFNVVC